MDLYVHINANNKPWIDAVSTTAQDGYTLKPALLDSQKLALLNFPDKCYVDDNGAVVTPNQLPLNDAEKQAQQTNMTIDNLQKQVTDLTSQINQANSDKDALQSQIASLMIEISKLQAPAQTTTTTGGGK